METQASNSKKYLMIVCSVLAVILLAIAGRFLYQQYLEWKNGTPAYSQDAVD